MALAAKESMATGRVVELAGLTNPETVMPDVFDLSGRVAAITGGAGLLGEQHARAIARAGGIPVLLDVSAQTSQKDEQLAAELGVSAWGRRTDITHARDWRNAWRRFLARFGRIDILINNAANNPKVENREDVSFSRFENFPLQQWLRGHRGRLNGRIFV